MPNISEYLFDRAILFIKAGKKDEAYEILADVLKADPKHVSAWAIRGQLEHEAGRSFNAMLHLNAAVACDPKRYEAWCNRGVIAMTIGLVGVAEDSYRRSLAIQDNHPARLNLGHLYSAKMEIDKAIEAYNGLLEKWPDDAGARTNLGLCHMTKGDWKSGWDHYRHRFNYDSFPPRPQIKYPYWAGEDVKGKTVLLFAEQGHGDEIMSLRLAASVKKMGARVIVCVRPPLWRIARCLTETIGIDAVTIMYDPLPWEPDYQCALLDVPHFCGLTPETIPFKDKYLKPSPRPYDSIKFPDGFKVGICWASGVRPLQPAADPLTRAKTIPLEFLSELARPGVVLVSLQQSHRDYPLLEKLGAINPMPGVQDFDDTAFIINQLDLVVTVDTAVAHLAGALGKPVWNLVRFDAMWPYGGHGKRTCWYDSMRIYRQSKVADWSEPIVELMNDFARITRTDRPANAKAGDGAIRYVAPMHVEDNLHL
jgi:Tfp pilus assembly protein PilF